MPPDIWIIMGHGDIGKSSTIRALTGVPRRKHTEIETVQGVMNRVWVEIRSLQENKISPTKFRRDHNNDRYILVNLRIDTYGIYPNGLAYLQDFINNNWQIRGISVLGSNPLPYSLPSGIPTPLHIPTTIHARIPANEMAHRIRNVWNWK